MRASARRVIVIEAFAVVAAAFALSARRPVRQDDTRSRPL